MLIPGNRAGSNGGRDEYFITDCLQDSPTDYAMHRSFPSLIILVE